MRRILLLLICCMAVAYAKSSAQQTNSSRSTGSCSPAVSGNSNQMVINCNGLSAAKASQLVALMNRILSEHLDMSQVNLKLDQMDADVRSMHSDLRNLTSNMNSVRKASAEERKLLDQANELTQQCTAAQQDWSDSYRQAPRTGRYVTPEQIHEIDGQAVRKYNSHLEPLLSDWRMKAAAKYSDLQSLTNYASVSSIGDLNSVCTSFLLLSLHFRTLLYAELQYR